MSRSWVRIPLSAFGGNMGCLVSIFKKIFLILLLVAFFALGGYSFIKNKINDYKNPPRDKFIQTEANFGDFSAISSDYQLNRNFNLFGYKKITAKYLPTEQKITIFDLKDEKTLSVEDFKNGAIDEKIKEILDKTKDSIVTFEDFKIVEKGNFRAQNKIIPYIHFEANVKNIPFKNVSGVLGVYSTTNKKAKNPSTKVIFTMTDLKAYNPVICRDFVENIEF